MSAWKPGDVASVRCDSSEWHTALRVKMTGGEGDVWVCSVSGAQPSRFVAEARPLAVIDLEDHDALDPVIDLIWGDRDPSDRPATWRVREGLKSLLFTPPKPDEPQGLGAVVETANGDLYVRSKTITTVAHWKPAKGGERRKYEHLNVTRVLNDGWTS